MSHTTFQLFAKAPVAGMVKTRLCPPLSAEDAAVLYMRMIEHAALVVHAACARLAKAGSVVKAELWCAPDTAHPMLRQVAGHYGFALYRQVDGDLGAKMSAALESAMPGSVILIGSDAPALDADRLVAAADALTSHDAVVVPADDGGYVLIGCRGQVPHCFSSIRWSTPTVMDETRVLLDATGLSWTTLPPVWDVDTAADLLRLAADPRLSRIFDGIKTTFPVAA